MTQPSHPERISSFLLNLYGGDPFSRVYRASNRHRESHGEECGVYPSEPVKMRLLATLVKAVGAERVLEIGCGLGYSALWLAEATGTDGRIDTIDRFPEHAALARLNADEAGYADRIRVIEGEGTEVLAGLSGPYDLVHDDGWFGQEPPYLERMIALLRPGGLLALSNWFLLGESLADRTQTDWAAFAGPNWAEDVQAYARKIARHPRLAVAFLPSPWLCLAVKAT